jgi:hypothetical protein
MGTGICVGRFGIVASKIKNVNCLPNGRPRTSIWVILFTFFYLSVTYVIYTIILFKVNMYL